MNEYTLNNNVMMNLVTKLDSKDIVICFGMVCLSLTTVCLGMCICKTNVCINDKGIVINSMSLSEEI